MCVKEEERVENLKTDFGENPKVNMPTHKKKMKFPGIMDAFQWMQIISDLQW